jgi:hypothetical protein
MLVPDKQGMEDRHLEIWKKAKLLPKYKHDLLYSHGLARLIQELQHEYELNNIETEKISRNIREYYFQEISSNTLINQLSIIRTVGPGSGLIIFKEIKYLENIIRENLGKDAESIIGLLENETDSSKSVTSKEIEKSKNSDHSFLKAILVGFLFAVIGGLIAFATALFPGIIVLVIVEAIWGAGVANILISIWVWGGVLLGFLIGTFSCY